MEDTLRDEEFQDWILDALVLILVLIEDTLRVVQRTTVS